MSEMVERVAKAIEAAYWNKHNHAQSGWEDEARAAIAAMRIPTKEMVDAAWQHTGDPDWEDNVKIVWKSAIDEALK